MAYFLWGVGFWGSGVAHPAGTGPLASIPMAPGEAQESQFHPRLHPMGPMEGRWGQEMESGVVRSSLSKLREKGAVTALRVRQRSRKGSTHFAQALWGADWDSVESGLGEIQMEETKNHPGILRGPNPPDGGSSGRNQAQKDLAEPSSTEYQPVSSFTGSNPSSTPSGWVSNLTLHCLSFPTCKTGKMTRPTLQGGM